MIEYEVSVSRKLDFLGTIGTLGSCYYFGNLNSETFPEVLRSQVVAKVETLPVTWALLSTAKDNAVGVLLSIKFCMPTRVRKIAPVVLDLSSQIEPHARVVGVFYPRNFFVETQKLLLSLEERT